MTLRLVSQNIPPSSLRKIGDQLPISSKDILGAGRLGSVAALVEARQQQWLLRLGFQQGLHRGVSVLTGSAVVFLAATSGGALGPSVLMGSNCEPFWVALVWLWFWLHGLLRRFFRAGGFRLVVLLIFSVFFVVLADFLFSGVICCGSIAGSALWSLFSRELSFPRSPLLVAGLAR